MRLRKPYLLLIADVADAITAKTAFGLRDWAADAVIGQHRFGADAIDLGLPDLTPAEAARLGAGSIVIGAAPAGGVLPPHWIDALVSAARAGLDVVSGLHSRLGGIAALREAAESAGVALIDIRTPPAGLPVASGRKRPGMRLLTVGTDCAIGKKYAAIAVQRHLRRRGVPATFRATGQTGILIGGEGVPIDSVTADFIAGAAELLSPDHDPDHWDVIEGQGSLFHPAYAGVTLGLIHGSQPDAMVLCLDPARTTLDGWQDYPTPAVRDAVAAYEAAARLTNASARVIALSVNTARLDPLAAAALLDALEREHSLPAMDPLRIGIDRVTDLLVARTMPVDGQKNIHDAVANDKQSPREARNGDEENALAGAGVGAERQQRGAGAAATG